MIGKGGRGGDLNAHPGLVSEPAKEAPLTAREITTFHGDPFPAECCDHCAARRQEAVALRARARLLKESVLADEPRAVVALHALLLIGMMEARGLA